MADIRHFLLAFSYVKFVDKRMMNLRFDILVFYNNHYNAYDQEI